MPSFWTIALHGFLALAAFSASAYVYLEKKMFIGGRLATGAVYEFPFPANIVMALSLVLISVVMILSLSKKGWARKLSEWSLILSLVLFISGAFM